jgi:hypothetical protein
MQNRPILGLVNALTLKHRLDAFPEATFLRQAQQKVQRFASDAVFGVIEQNILEFEGKAGKPLLVCGKQLPHVKRFIGLKMRLQPFPGGSLSWVFPWEHREANIGRFWPGVDICMHGYLCFQVIEMKQFMFPQIARGLKSSCPI